MHAFVAASPPVALPVDPAAPAILDEAAARQAEQRALCQEAARLREQRRSRRQQRQQEDAAWPMVRRQHQAAQAPQAHARPTAASCPYSPRASDLHWRVLRLRRRLTLIRRRHEDAVWRAARQQLRERLGQPPCLTSWIAVLVITDNCTRQCLSLPLCVAGPKVTAELVVDALRTLLPPELQFLKRPRDAFYRPDLRPVRA